MLVSPAPGYPEVHPKRRSGDTARLARRRRATMKASCVRALVVLTLVCAAVPLLSSVTIVVLICAPVYGQWVKVPAGGIPKGPDGKPNLAAPAPRSTDGHPDLSGV